MDINLYSDLKRSMPPVSQRPYTEGEVRKKSIDAFCKKIRDILSSDSLDQMLELFFKLESSLYTTSVEVGDDNSELVSLKEFYRALSPMLLRTLWDSMRANRSREDLLRSLQEAIRVALEEELYYWNGAEKLN